MAPKGPNAICHSAFSEGWQPPKCQKVLDMLIEIHINRSEAPHLVLGPSGEGNHGGSLSGPVPELAGTRDLSRRFPLLIFGLGLQQDVCEGWKGWGLS